MHLTSKQRKTNKRVALISTPWPLYNRPSIQLGALKAYLQSIYPDMQVDCHHFYLKLAESIGYRQYHEISKRTWLAETVYAALLYPEQLQQIEKLFNRESGRKSVLRTDGLRSITAKVKKISDDFISSRNWGDYLLAGFSVSLCQLTSALYFIKRIKKKFPELIIVIGGSTFSGSATGDFFKLFPEVDAVINGEGELPFSQLIGCLTKLPSISGVPPIKGLSLPGAANDHNAAVGFQQITSLNSLPPPDYDDYFSLLKSFDSPNMFFPTLPVETSRGCWWQRPTNVSSKVLPKMPDPAAGCAFCNLNLQWEGYRTKKPSQVADEIDHLTGRHQTLSVTLVDNVLPRNTSTEIFTKLDRLKKDLRLFSEIRATTSWAELKAMAQAGTQEVQIGIEALSTPLLKKLHKGTTTIQNLEIMKNCEALGIENISNLIICFPGSDERDVVLTLQNIEFALPYRPLKTAAFWLIYLFCRHHRSLKKIRDRFPTFSEDKIIAFLKMMVDKKLMFEENNRYLSLAVPVNP